VSAALHELGAFEPAVLALGDALRSRGWRLATAESCTGGLIAAACTAVAGSSDWFERGFVTYSNEAKVESLGVDPALLAAHGAVSEEAACARAAGAQAHARAELAVAVTGIAGPGGGTPVAERLQLDGDRATVRGRTVARALAALLATVRA
jgi:nicotinamide-nucleotide amidase